MLKMKKGNQWVDLPKSLEPKMPTAKGPVEYRFTETHTNFLQDGRKKTEFRHEIALPSIFTIRVEGENTPITLGLVGGYDERGNPHPGEIQALTFQPQRIGGKLYVHPDQSDEQLAMYMALELHPWVGKNSNPDENTPKVMEKVDSAAEAKARMKAREDKRNATALATGLKAGDELYRAALILGINPDREEDVVRDEIEQSAENDPSAFVTKMKSEDVEIKADFAHALKLGLISIDGQNKTLRWANDRGEIMQLVRTDAENAAREYAAFVNGDKNGQTIHKSVQNVLSTTKKVSQKAKPASE